MKPLTRLTEFVLEQAELLPLARRAQIYRDLAAIAPTEKESAAFTALALGLEKLDARHHQLRLNFRGRRTAEGQA